MTPSSILGKALLIGTGLGVVVPMKPNVPISSHASQGVVVSRPASSPSRFHWEKPTETQPNKAMLEAMAKIAAIQKGMTPKEGKSSLEYLREAREGRMYGYGSDE